MNWRVSLFTVALFAFVIAWGWATSSTGLCDLQVARVASTTCPIEDADKDKVACAKDGATSCTEFWINRYQSSIAAFVAVLAAILAWVGVQQQVDAARQQVDIASRQFAASALAPLQQRAQSLRALLSAMSDAFHNVERATNRVRQAVLVIDVFVDTSAYGLDGKISAEIDMLQNHNKQFAQYIEHYQNSVLDLGLLMEQQVFESSIKDETENNLKNLANYLDTLKKTADVFHFLEILREKRDDTDVREFWKKQYNIKQIMREVQCPKPDYRLISAGICNIDRAIDRTLKMTKV